MDHHHYMARALDLAQNGLGTTYPNPLVGCVIVHKDKIIGQGWHHHAGGPHAEVMAIASVKDESLLAESTLYVSLEPCSHFGKTPPCANLIIEKKIPHVVVCNVDPNPQVAGSGINRLTEAGIKVESGIMEDEGRIVNRRFFTFHEKKRPFIILKWAQSADGFIAPETSNREPVWISSPLSRQLVHKWRTEEPAILAGTQTVIDDNPKLSARDWQGNQPTRIIIDRTGRIEKESHIFDNQLKTTIFHNSDRDFPTGVESVRIAFENCPREISDALYKLGIQSVIVEGGRKTLQSFIDAKMWDEARVFTGAANLGPGVPAPVLNANLIEKTTICPDGLAIYRP